MSPRLRAVLHCVIVCVACTVRATGKDHRFVASDGKECAYGPADACTIDTTRSFHVRIEFTDASELFGFTVTLEQNEEPDGSGTRKCPESSPYPCHGCPLLQLTPAVTTTTQVR